MKFRAFGISNTTDVSEEYITSIVRVEEEDKQNNRRSRSQAELSASTGSLLGLFFNPEDGGDMFLRNIVLSRKYTHKTVLFN
jgi:hypothetical protein